MLQRHLRVLGFVFSTTLFITPMLKPKRIVIVVLLHLLVQESWCLRCWVCGEDASLHVTNPDSSVSPSRSRLKASWCTTSVTNASCERRGVFDDDIRCYKELWNVDGQQLVKRGCAVRDERYERPGCEEQITGDNNFNLVLCLCNTDLCNGTDSLRDFHLPIFLVGLQLLLNAFSRP